MASGSNLFRLLTEEWSYSRQFMHPLFVFLQNVSKIDNHECIIRKLYARNRRRKRKNTYDLKHFKWFNIDCKYWSERMSNVLNGLSYKMQHVIVSVKLILWGQNLFVYLAQNLLGAILYGGTSPNQCANGVTLNKFWQKWNGNCANTGSFDIFPSLGMVCWG